MAATETRFDLLISFVSVHDAVRAEHLLTAAGVTLDAIPTPREIDLSCGQSLLLAADDGAVALAVLRENGARWSGRFLRVAPRIWEKLNEQEG